MQPLRYGIKVPFFISNNKQLYLSKHRTLEAAEKRVLAYTRKYPTSGVPSIVDITTGKYV